MVHTPFQLCFAVFFFTMCIPPHHPHHLHHNDLYLHIYAHIDMCIYKRTHTYTHACIYACIHICMDISCYRYNCTCIYKYASTLVSVYQFCPFVEIEMQTHVHVQYTYIWQSRPIHMEPERHWHFLGSPRQKPKTGQQQNDFNRKPNPPDPSIRKFRPMQTGLLHGGTPHPCREYWVLFTIQLA